MSSASRQAQLPDFTDKMSTLIIFVLSIMATLLYRFNPQLPKNSVILILGTVIILNYLVRRQLKQLFSAFESNTSNSETKQQWLIRDAIQTRSRLHLILNTYLPHISVSSPFDQPTLRTFNIVFLDLRNFTQFSADSTLARVTELINKFYSVISQGAKSHAGIISAFLGDGAMLLFDRTDDAVACVHEIQKKLPKDLQLCAGLHKGQMAYGCFGHEHCSFTAIGDAVNTASRVEASTRALGCWFLCSNAVSWPNTRLAGVVELKGKGTMELYEVCDADKAALTREIEICEKMMRFQAAADVSAKALEQYPEDRIFKEKYRTNVQRANQFVIDLPNIDEIESAPNSE